jgi:hypothetical protein
MVPPDDDSKQAVPGYDVDLKTRAIRFLGCKDQEAMISAAENRVAALSSMIGARSGFTNRERRGMNRERNCLHRWCSTWSWQGDGATLAIEKHLRGPAAARAPVLISFQPDGKWSYQVVL